IGREGLYRTGRTLRGPAGGPAARRDGSGRGAERQPLLQAPHDDRYDIWRRRPSFGALQRSTASRSPRSRHMKFNRHRLILGLCVLALIVITELVTQPLKVPAWPAYVTWVLFFVEQ